MARDKKKMRGTDRREFLTGASAALAFGAVAGLARSTPSAAVEPTEKPVSGRIEHNSSLCAELCSPSFSSLRKHRMRL
jgi:hypothetical protein